MFFPRVVVIVSCGGFLLHSICQAAITSKDECNKCSQWKIQSAETWGYVYRTDFLTGKRWAGAREETGRNVLCGVIKFDRRGRPAGAQKVHHAGHWLLVAAGWFHANRRTVSPHAVRLPWCAAHLLQLPCTFGTWVGWCSVGALYLPFFSISCCNRTHRGSSWRTTIRAAQ